ncbi:MAG TPA: hypothetical protein VF950_20530 [Planctomycetota bacterium]
MGRGFGYSVYFMLTLLFGIAGIIVFIVARTIAREERQRREREARNAAGGS